MIIVSLLTGSLFVTSGTCNDINEKTLYFNGETIVIAEIKPFFTKLLKVIEDASNPGDSEHMIQLYKLSFSCTKLPSKHTQEYLYFNTSELPLTTIYLLEGSTIQVNLCAATTVTEIAERTEVLIYDNLEFAKSPDIELNNFIDFGYFATGTDDDWKCGKYWYKAPRNSYYVITFLQPAHPTQYNTTIVINKKAVDLASAMPTSNCSLQYDKDECTFNFPLTTQTNCIVADIQQDGRPENRRFIHGILQSKPRQGNILVGIILSFSLFFIVAVFGISYLIFVVCTQK